MLVLHGCTQQSTSLRADGNLEPAAEQYGIVVALPQVPNGGVIAGCWDYYGAAHTRANKHNAAIFEIVASLRDDRALGVDAKQVYIAGLSSGAGQAAVSACLAPDLFAGVGINAGPMVGTSSSEASFVAGTTAAGVATCRAFSGAQSAHFDTQLASIIYGSMDFVVAKGYGQRNADVLRTIYGHGTPLEGRSLDVTVLPGFQPAGTGMVYSDALGPRIEQVEVSGMGHAFPAGSGDGLELSFIARRGPSWPMMLARFFSVNNRRIERGERPVELDAGVSVGADASPAVTDASPVVSDASVSGRPDHLDAGASADSDASPDPIDASVSGSDPEESTGCRCFQGGPGAGALLELLCCSLLFGLSRRAFGRRRAT